MYDFSKWSLFQLWKFIATQQDYWLARMTSEHLNDRLMKRWDHESL